MAVLNATSNTRHGDINSVRIIARRAPYFAANEPQNGPATAVINGEMPSAMPDQVAAAIGSWPTRSRTNSGMNGVTRFQAVLLVAATTSRVRRLRSRMVRCDALIGPPDPAPSCGPGSVSAAARVLRLQPRRLII